MRWKIKAFVFCLIIWSGYTTASRAEDSGDPSRFTYARLYCGPAGDTHFQDVTAELHEMNFAPPAPPIHIGSDVSASRAFFGGFDAGWEAHDLETRLNHPTPRFSSVSFYGVSFPSLQPMVRRDASSRAPCFDWRTPHPAKDTSLWWAINLDFLCSFAEGHDAIRAVRRSSATGPDTSSTS